METTLSDITIIMPLGIGDSRGLMPNFKRSQKNLMAIPMAGILRNCKDSLSLAARNWGQAIERGVGSDA